MNRVSTLTLWGAVLLAVLAAPGPTRAAGKAAGAKPVIAVVVFKNKVGNPWWSHGGARAAQDVFVAELVKSGKFRVVDRERLEALLKLNNCMSSPTSVPDADAVASLKAADL